MRYRVSRAIRLVVSLILVAGLCAAGFKGLPLLKQKWDALHPPVETTTVSAERAKPRGHLVSGERNTLLLPEEVVQTLRVATAEVQQAPSPEPLKLDGSLFLDANRFVHVNTRFAGEVVELGQVEATSLRSEQSTDENRIRRSVSVGDHVRKGQLLAVVWSKELGEKKSELVEALARLHLDETKLKKLEGLLAKGSVAERTVQEAQRDVETGLIAVARAERTLRSWRLSTAEIQAIRAEAEKVHLNKGQADKDVDESWARVEIRALMEGTIVEKSVAPGDYVTTDLDLFKIADLRRLDVLAHAYEEDLPLLERLPPEQRTWRIFLNAEPQAPPLEGHIERIGSIIDPAQHTGLVMGWVDNSSGRLRAGQFVTVQVPLPPDAEEVAIPVSAVVDYAGEARIFVESESTPHQFTSRTVLPTRRRDNWVFIKSNPTDVSGKKSFDPLHVGERVVTVGSVELAAELETLQTAEHATASTGEASR